VLSDAIDPTHVGFSRKSQKHGNEEEHAGEIGEAQDIQLPFPMYKDESRVFYATLYRTMGAASRAEVD
jgi:hypothetical protein